MLFFQANNHPLLSETPLQLMITKDYNYCKSVFIFTTNIFTFFIQCLYNFIPVTYQQIARKQMHEHRIPVNLLLVPQDLHILQVCLIHGG